MFDKGIFFMFKIRFLSFIFVIGVNQASAVKMTWDNPESGTGLHVYHKGTKFTVREIQKEDTQFYQDLFKNSKFVKAIGSGEPKSKEGILTEVEGWIKRFSDGIPTGRMILEQENTPIGFVHLGPNTTPGVGELARGLVPGIQGGGLGKAALEFIVNEWAPAVQKRGEGLDIDKKHPSVEKFQCFKGEPLRLIYTTAKPSNPASWQCYKYFQFHPSKPTNQTYQISCENWEESQHGPLEDYIIKLHFSEESSDRLQVNVRYSMLDETGTLRTLSYVKEYESLRYHFEKKVGIPTH